MKKEGFERESESESIRFDSIRFLGLDEETLEMKLVRERG